MLNKIWFWLLVIGILYAPAKLVLAPVFGFELAAEQAAVDGEPIPPPSFTDLGKGITNSAIDGAKAAVELCLSLIGPMVLWLGLMEIAKDAGLVEGIAWLLRPIMRWLFPEVPEGHPAHGAMLMNISANMLNLSNAATPLGLKAMQELETLNTEKGTATNSMATFLAINTSSVTLVPFIIIGLRSAAGSEDPAGPMVGIFMATCVSTIIAVIVVRALSKLPVYAKTAPAPAEWSPEAKQAEVAQ